MLSLRQQKFFIEHVGKYSKYFIKFEASFFSTVNVHNFDQLYNIDRLPNKDIRYKYVKAAKLEFAGIYICSWNSDELLKSNNAIFCKEIY